GVRVTRIDTLHEADLLYRGQTHILRVPIDERGFEPERMLARFAERYRERFEIELPEMRAVLVNLRTAVVGRRATQRLPADLELFAAPGRVSPGSPARVASPPRVRRVHFDEDWLETVVYRRDDLRPGARIDGPAIVEQLDATTVIDPGDTAEVDAYGNLI